MAFALVPRSTLRLAQRVVEGQMTDTCRVEREAPGKGTYDPTTFRSLPDIEEIYRGRCYFGDRVEGALTTGGFGANAQETAFPGRTHTMFLRLPMSDPACAHVRVGDFVYIEVTDLEMDREDRYRVIAREEGTHRASLTFRLNRFDPDQVRS